MMLGRTDARRGAAREHDEAGEEPGAETTADEAHPTHMASAAGVASLARRVQDILQSRADERPLPFKTRPFKNR